MNAEKEKIYEFEKFRLDIGERVLLHEGKLVTVTPKVFDLLTLLVENADRLMTKEELIDRLWENSFVEEANLNVNISALRRALGEKPNEQRFVKTVPRHGYRFVAEVREVTEEEPRVDNTDLKSASNAATISLGASPRQCPKCLRIYYDKSLNYCLQDGEKLEDILPREPHPKKTAKRRAVGRLLFVSFALLLGILAAVVLFWKSSNTSNVADVSQLRVIAVLPFRPLTNDQSDPALQMGMSDALITKLSSLQQITVRPTSAIEKYSDASIDPIVAGRELQVEAVLDGKIQRADNQIRVTVQLLRVSDGATLWGGSFDNFFTNIFAVQDSISEKMTTSLKLKLSGEEQKAFVKRYTENTDAYDLYLQGLNATRSGTPEAIANSLEYFNRAIEKDPNYSLVYAAASQSYVRLATYSIETKRNAELARAMAAKAASLDPDSASVNSALGAIAYEIDLNLSEAEKYFNRAREISPGAASPLSYHAQLLADLGRTDDALQEIERARHIDPVSTGLNVSYLEILVDSGRGDQAIDAAQRLLAEYPRSVFYRRHLGRAYASKGMYNEAIQEYLKDVEFGGMKKAPALLGFAYAKAGRIDEAKKILEDRIEHAGEPTNPFYGVALIYAGLGNNDKAFEWLEKSYKEKEPAIFAIKASPEWTGIRSDPRYLDLAKRLGLEQ